MSFEVASRAIHEYHAMQNMIEFGVIHSYVADRSPRTIVEIGSARGGSLWAWSQIPSVTRVISVTLSTEEYGDVPSSLPASVNVIVGDSRTSETKKKVYEALGGALADFVWIDGGHDYETALNDFHFAHWLIQPRGIIGIHDLYLHRRVPSSQVNKVWRHIRQRHPHWLMWEIVANPHQTPGTGIIELGVYDEL